jgi:hypothetical protein
MDGQYLLKKDSKNAIKTGKINSQHENDKRTKSDSDSTGPGSVEGSLESAARFTGRGTETVADHDSHQRERAARIGGEQPSIRIPIEQLKMVVGCHLSAFGVPAAEFFASRCKSASFVSEVFKPETGQPRPEL